MSEPVNPSRRGFLGASGMMAFWPLASAMAATDPGADATPKLFDPDYAREPLRADRVRHMLIQSPDMAIDWRNPEKGRKKNLDYMLGLLDKANTWFSGQQDLISFHEMPLHGFGEWNRKQMLRVAVDLPGPETEALGKKAREMNCYISFGAYARDPDWPNHVIMMGVLIGPDGGIAAKHWKARGTLGGLGLYTSTVYECFDRYVEMYGMDAVIPVARTDIGNICLSGVQYDPMLFMAMALKGAELLLRYATGRVPREDAIAMSRSFRMYTSYANSSVFPGHRHYVGGVGAGGSIVVDPNGKVLAEAGEDETGIRATLPMAEFRESHRPPSPQWALYEPIMRQFKPRFDPGWFLRYLPKSWRDTRRYFADKANW